MKLTQAERLILYNQVLILEKLDPTNDNWRLQKLILERGYEHDYGDCALMLDTPFSEEKCAEVRDILDMYEHIEASHEKLPPEDKKRFQDWEVMFRGWDGNNEIGHRYYAKFIVEEREGYHTIGKRAYDNTHSPTLRRCLTMLAKYRQVMDHNGHGALTKDQLLEVVGAWREVIDEENKRYAGSKK